MVHAFPHPGPFWRPWEKAGVPGLESRHPELSGVLGCLQAIVFSPHHPRFFFFPSLPKMLTGFYFVFFRPVNSPDGVGYMGKKCGCLWEEEHIEFQSRRLHDMQLRQKLIGNKDFPGKHG